MPITITMPALSPTMEEGNLVKWLVSEGEKVLSGDVIAEVETDKATMEIESIDEGVLARILVPAGTVGVKVNSAIAFLVQEGEKLPDNFLVGKPKGVEQQDIHSKDKEVAEEILSPAKNIMENNARGRYIFSSPLARRLARRVGIDLTLISGTGPHGRIIKSDIDAAMEQQKKPEFSSEKSQGASSAAAIVQADLSLKEASDKAILEFFSDEEYKIITHNTMRKTIARRLVKSKQIVPHFYVTVDCELDDLLTLRSTLNAAANAAALQKTKSGTVPTYKISINDMIVKAVALTLKHVPDANVAWLEQGILRHKHVNVGVAVSIPGGGVITPVVRCIDKKSLLDISNEMKDFVTRARQRKLNPEEYRGGSTAVSNMGMYGVKEFSAIINSPQATIFAIGAAEKRVVVKHGETTGVATIMTVTISADHRVIDGALAAELARNFKNLIENPYSIVV